MRLYSKDKNKIIDTKEKIENKENIESNEAPSPVKLPDFLQKELERILEGLTKNDLSTFNNPNKTKEVKNDERIDK